MRSLWRCSSTTRWASLRRRSRRSPRRCSARARRSCPPPPCSRGCTSRTATSPPRLPTRRPRCGKHPSGRSSCWPPWHASAPSASATRSSSSAPSTRTRDPPRGGAREARETPELGPRPASLGGRHRLVRRVPGGHAAARRVRGGHTHRRAASRDRADVARLGGVGGPAEDGRDQVHRLHRRVPDPRGASGRVHRSRARGDPPERFGVAGTVAHQSDDGAAVFPLLPAPLVAAARL
mmetsp:Transcript_4316/g.13907  ORF Transcript_4316/g.13907 Transcript_4316/m.13907 type:complete len:236 (-) Transcript_4316:324-1031(-)